MHSLFMTISLFLNPGWITSYSSLVSMTEKKKQNGLQPSTFPMAEISEKPSNYAEAYHRWLRKHLRVSARTKQSLWNKECTVFFFKKSYATLLQHMFIPYMNFWNIPTARLIYNLQVDLSNDKHASIRNFWSQ